MTGMKVSMAKLRIEVNLLYNSSSSTVLVNKAYQSKLTKKY